MTISLNKSLVKYLSWPAFTVLILAVSACSTAEFKDQPKKEREAAPLEKKKKFEEKLGRESEDKDEEASMPVEVSGAFLACVSSSPSTESSMQVDCAVYDGEGQLMGASGTQTWEVLAQDQEVPMQQVSAPIGYTASFITNAAVDQVKFKDYLYGMSLRTSVERPLQLVAEKQPVRLGDNNYSGSVCKSTLQQYENQGHRLKIELQQDQALPLRLSLDGICGIDRAGNSIEVVVDGKIYLNTDLKNIVGSQGFWLPPATVVELSFGAGNYASDYDDFLITDIQVSGGKGLRVTDMQLD